MSSTLRSSDITIRLADYGDTRAVLRLAALDCAPVPEGALLLAEVDGVAVAAAPVGGGRAIADPFRRTAPIVAMLELRAAQLAGESSRAAWRRRLPARLGAAL